MIEGLGEGSAPTKGTDAVVRVGGMFGGHVAHLRFEAGDVVLIEGRTQRKVFVRPNLVPRGKNGGIELQPADGPPIRLAVYGETDPERLLMAGTPVVPTGGMVGPFEMVIFLLSSPKALATTRKMHSDRDFARRQAIDAWQASKAS